MIVVTGGAGFIGSCLLASLEKRGVRDLVVCDWLGSDEKWRNIAKRDLFDIVTPERLQEFLNDHARDVEMIFHLGAISSTTATDGDLVVDRNLRFSQMVWQWCVAHGVRFVYASSAATYGDGASGFDDVASVEGLAHYQPLNLYGWSKHAFDRQIARSLESGRPRPPQWAGLKFFNVYGPNEYHKGGQQSVVAHLYPKIAAGEPARLFKSGHPDYADGGQLRDFIWVGDTVDVMLWLLDTPAASGLFNVGTGQARSFEDLAKAVFTASGREEAIEYFEMPDQLRSTYQYFTQARVERLRAAGYTRSFTSLEDGVATYVRDFLATTDPYM